MRALKIDVSTTTFPHNHRHPHIFQVYENSKGFSFRLMRNGFVVLHSGKDFFASLDAANIASEKAMVLALNPLSYSIHPSPRGTYFFSISCPSKRSVVAKSGAYDSVKQANKAIYDLINHLKI